MRGNCLKALMGLGFMLMISTLSAEQSKIEEISAQFLGRPYKLFPLGDGEAGRYDQAPLYRLDQFDCDTFVNTVLALALSNSPAGYRQCLRMLRYEQGKVDFLTRRHFTAVDWNLPHQKRGILKDVTKRFVDEHHHPVYQLSETTLDKGGWYRHLSIDRIHLKDPTLREARLEELKRRGAHLPPVQSRVPYLPLTALFSADGIENQALFSQFPDASIVEIVRPNWALKSRIGTNLDISHLGFVFRKNGKLWFRNASSTLNKVVDQLFIDYLRETRHSPTIKGVNVQIFLPSKGTLNCVR